MTAAPAAEPMTGGQATVYQRLRAHLAYLKLPTAAEALPAVLDAARAEGLSMTAALERLLEAEVAATEDRRRTGRLRFASLPAPWTLEELDYDASPGLDRALISDLASLRFLDQATNVLLIGPPGVGKTHLATALGTAACHAGHRVLFATATDWVTRLQDAHQRGRLAGDLAKLRRYGLIVIDEVGYLPFAPDAANLFFQLVSSRYEHASLILTSNLPFARWGDVFGDQTIAAAMIDRIVHHADVHTLKGASYRLKHLTDQTLPSVRAEQAH